MNIIILEDLKGFRKIIEVPRFPPDYHIAITDPISVKIFDHEKTYQTPTNKEIIFYPKGEPKEEYGTYILLYRQYE